jgi:2-methylcitrate dehydratase PrpD
LSATRTLAQFVVDPPSGLVSDRAQDVAKRSIRDAIGVAVRAAGTPIAHILKKAVSDESGRFDVLGSDWRACAYASTLANGALIHAEDWDDMGGCGGHPTAALLPVLLTLAQDHRLSGEEFLRAYVVGYQSGTAVARNMLGSTGFDRPWHPSGVIGPIAAACAGAAALGLDEEQTVGAIGIAAGMAGGIRASFGTDVKPLQLGHAAATGYLATVIAAAGGGGDPEALERRNGYAACFSPRADWKYLSYDLNEHRYLEYDDDRHTAGFGPVIKPWPVCGGNNLALTAVAQLLTQAHLKSRDRRTVESVSLVENVDRPAGSLFRTALSRGRDGKFNLRYNVALLALYGDVLPEMFTDEAMNQLLESGMMDRVHWRQDTSLGAEPVQCHATVTFDDGTEASAVEFGRGAVLEGDAAELKFESCVLPRLGNVRLAKLQEVIEKLELLDDASQLLANSRKDDIEET